MNDSILEGLFDSKIKVKLLRLFLRNPQQGFTLDEVIKRIHSDPSSTRYQLRKLRKINLLSSKLTRLGVEDKDEEKNKKIGRERRVYQANPLFQFYNELKSLILKSTPEVKDKLIHELKKAGRIKLALITGVFMNVDNARVDLLVVSDDIKRINLVRVIKNVEAELGHEIKYAVMNQQEFDYRLDMYDNFVKALMQLPHEKLIDTFKDM
jgi:predicted transcriptional regulator with HTH domain